MKNNYKLILGLIVILLLAGMAWQQKTSLLSLIVPIQPKNKTSSTLAAPATGNSPKTVQAASNASSTGKAAQQKKFINMSARECNAVLREIRKQDFYSIMRAWLNAGRVENDPAKQGSIVTIWGWEMKQRTVPPEVYEKMKAVMADSSYSIYERGQMIGVLAEAATPEAANLLIYEATTQTDAEMKRMATVALSALGDTYNEANAILLEPLWKESNDPVMMQWVNPKDGVSP